MQQLNGAPDRRTSATVVEAEHLLLAAMIQELRNAMAMGDGRSGCVAIFGRLVDYAGEHFRHEESLMEADAYPELERHREEHQGFIRRLRELATDLRRERMALSMDVLELLEGWLRHHVRNADQRYLDHVG
jgi:hemerythrin